MTARGAFPKIFTLLLGYFLNFCPLQMEYVNELMKLAIAQHRERGRIFAEIEWIKCWDINGVSEKLRDFMEHLQSITKKISTTMFNLDLIMSDERLDAFVKDCEELEREEKRRKEIVIEKENRPSGVNFDHDLFVFTTAPIDYNKRALVNLSQCEIPDDIGFALSFGPKFLFPYNTTNENLYEIIAQIDKCIEDAVSPMFQHKASNEIMKILSKRDKFKHDMHAQWLNFINYRTVKFLEENEDIVALKSDKGGHVVLVDKNKYDTTVDEMLNDNNYEQLPYDPITLLVENEKKLMNIAKKNYKCKKVASSVMTYQPATLQLAKFYGLPKVHKPGFKLRPIVAMRGSPGHALGKIFNEMLKEIFPISHFHIKDSFQAKKFFDGVSFPSNYTIKSWDVVSMFTNIPIDLAKDIINEKQTVFLNKFGIGKNILSMFLKFLLEDSTVFTANGKIYKQKDGLPMGGCISPTIARLVMDKIARHLLERVKEIAFIKIFVDDTITAIDPLVADRALEILNSFHPKMKFTVENENEELAVNFLNLTVYRDEGRIKTNWYRKSFASGRLVPFFSSHKRTTVIGTAESFIKTVILLSDSSFFRENKSIVYDTLKSNAFPEWLIDTLMNKHYTLMTPACGSEQKKMNKRANRYVIFPHAICKSRDIKKILLSYTNKDIILADSTKNTKINQVRNRKTVTEWYMKSNMILISKCKCGKKYLIEKTAYNQTAGMLAREMKTKHNICKDSMHSFKKIIPHRGLAYSSQTQFLLRYLRLIFDRKGSLGSRASLPNYHLSKLMINAELPTSLKNKLG